jgi:uncharacterized protein (DUF885 family)
MASSVSELSDRYVERWAALDPVGATARGVLGHDHELTDYSPDGAAARADLARTTLAELRASSTDRDDDRRAAAVLAERLDTELALHEAEEHLRPLRVIASPVSGLRMCFDLMPTETVEHWATIATRMEKLPGAVDGVHRLLDESLARGLTSARRQALACAEQCATWAGETGSTPYFAALVGRADGAGLDDTLRRRLTQAADHAGAAYADLGRYLRDTYAPKADQPDGVGADRYRLLARASLGAEIDPHETYAWGWDELRRIESDMTAVAAEIEPDTSVEEVKQLLETDPERSIEGVERFRGWLQELMDRTVAELDGVHFSIPEPVKRVEAMIAPPGSAAAMYYTGPSEDFSRPGRTWYPTLGKTRFPTWGEVSIAYHEGVPGHHLQIAQVRYLRDALTRFQRMTGTSGHAEGWALYAERLMDELGYLADPAHKLGMLRAQCMRAVRVVVDIGLHLGLRIAADDRFHPGETWTPELAEAFVVERSHFPADFMASEIVRYLGWPGQAISYKVGERVWLEGRADAKRRHGGDFDLRRFHAEALDLGPMGLDQLHTELAAL